METKLESTLKSSLEIKEEKIAALEARLQESSNLNQQLRQELKTVSDSILKVFHADASREGLLFFFLNTHCKQSLPQSQNTPIPTRGQHVPKSISSTY